MSVGDVPVGDVSVGDEPLGDVSSVPVPIPTTVVASGPALPGAPAVVVADGGTGGSLVSTTTPETKRMDGALASALIGAVEETTPASASSAATCRAIRRGPSLAEGLSSSCPERGCSPANTPRAGSTAQHSASVLSA